MFTLLVKYSELQELNIVDYQYVIATKTLFSNILRYKHFS